MAKSEILATGQFTEYTHRFGDFIYQMQYISGLETHKADESKGSKSLL